ncbi:hypothetical protein I5M27_15065 [Adhaeribacter sp. BT258]|uniref:Uncharacterized protein n=1 Tax=Adhaeribacter terrigena TaxID=2793070 RepID=A0ABS1C551_9BACT|nr:hypothetical protein [Adhaeribacter terrigena]MBK0404316.1 hypothetical protein [Adhaeribacter terrigena]
MNTKLLMTLSSVFMAATGLAFSFFPQEFLTTFNEPASPIMMLILQLLGALYLGFAMLNYMAKGSIMGGIYNRPIAIGNFMHFLVAGLALLKSTPGLAVPQLWGLAVIYAGFALAFGFVVFTHPKAVKA